MPDSNNGPCPNCGYCQHCGRGTQPIPNYPSPYWQPIPLQPDPWFWWNTTITPDWSNASTTTQWTPTFTPNTCSDITTF